MKYKAHIPPFLRSSLLPLACAACISQVNGAGTESWTTAYATIQPNATGDAFVYTISWVAIDTLFGTGTTPKIINSPYGNGNSELDNPYVFGDNRYSIDNSANGGTADTEIQYVSSGTEANAATQVLWEDPQIYTLGHMAPVTSNAKWDDLGNFTDLGNLTYGSGIQNVTGVFSPNPDGSGASTGTGVGIYVDEDGGAGSPLDDLGPLLSGFTTAQTPNKGYIRVEVPYPAGYVTSTAFTAAGQGGVVFNGTHTDNGAIELVVTDDPDYTPKIAVAGDLDSDFDVDTADLSAASAGFGGAATTGKFYRSGDMNADGDSDNADLGMVIGAFTPGSASATTADLVYDPTTGNVKLDASEAAGAIIVSFQLENGAGTFEAGSYVSPGGSFGTSYQDVTANVIGDTDTSLAGFSGITDLGNILPAGLDLAGLEAYMTNAVYTGVPGSGQQQFDLVISSGGDPTYATWSGGAAADQDTNGDGVENALAWTLGASDVNVNATRLLPTLDNTSDPAYVIFNFNRSDAAQADASTTIGVEYASDLVGWTSAVDDGENVIIEVTDGDPTDAVKVKLKRSTLGASGRIFVRLNVVVAR